MKLLSLILFVLCFSPSLGAQFATLDVRLINSSSSGIVCPGENASYAIRYQYGLDCRFEGEGCTSFVQRVLSNKLILTAENGVILQVTDPLGVRTINSSQASITLPNIGGGTFQVVVRWDKVSSTSKGKLAVAVEGTFEGLCVDVRNATACSSLVTKKIAGGIDLQEEGLNVFPNNLAVTFGTNDALFCNGRATFTTIVPPDSRCADVVAFDWYIGTSNTQVATTSSNSTTLNFNAETTQSVGVRFRYANNGFSPIYRRTFNSRRKSIVGPDIAVTNSRDGTYQFSEKLGISGTGKFAVVPSSGATIEGLGSRVLVIFSVPGTYEIRFTAVECGKTKTWSKVVTAVRSGSRAMLSPNLAANIQIGDEDIYDHMSKISIYPTLLEKGSSTINVTGIDRLFNMTDCTLTIYNSLGSEVSTIPLASKIDLSPMNLGSGIYIVTLNSPNKSSSLIGKVVVN